MCEVFRLKKPTAASINSPPPPPERTDLPLPHAPGLVLGRPGRDPFALSAGVEVP